MPTFNRLEFLRPAVESVFSQTFKDWELIVADDGSSEPTGAYLRTLQDHPRVVVISMHHTGKPSVVINMALRKARGEYVAFLDSDDLWLPRKLETQMASLRRPRARMELHQVCADRCFRRSHRPGAQPRLTDAQRLDFCEKLLEKNIVIAQPGVIISRRFLLELGAFEQALVMCYDDELLVSAGGAQSGCDGVNGAPSPGFAGTVPHSGSNIIAFARAGAASFKKTLRRRYGGCVGFDAAQATRTDFRRSLRSVRRGSGRGWDAIATLVVESHPQSWRYPRCWLMCIHFHPLQGVRASIRSHAGTPLWAPPATRAIYRVSSPNLWKILQSVPEAAL